MDQTWPKVRVFISSTFKDMNAERDWLMRMVFPELKERCRKRHVQLIDMDLRWGVTQKQTEDGEALDICLDEIDSCRPYFLGLLGYRYGYVPRGHHHSITTQEIYHGVLHHNLPRQVKDLNPIVRGILEGRTLFKEQISCLLHSYQWNPQKRKYLCKKSITPKDKKTLHSIFDGYSIYQRDRSFFLFRSESLTKKLAGSQYKDYFEIKESRKGKLEALKQEIIAEGLQHFEYNDLETFGHQVLEALWGRIDVEFPENREKKDWQAEEREFQELFIADRTRRFVGRSDILKRMHNFIEDDSDSRMMVIIGDPGCGKSALLARFTEDVINSEFISQHHDWLIFPHFVGASPSSTSIRFILRRLCIQLSRTLGVKDEVPEDYKELAQLFPELLQKVSETHRIILIIDALNQLEITDDAHSLRWFPRSLPRNVKAVISTLDGDVLDTFKGWRSQPEFEELTGLTKEEIDEFVTGYLKEVGKDFPTLEIKQVFNDKIKSGNPLYIQVALEELRVFPTYDEVGARVSHLPDTVPELFEQVLERIESGVESDFNRSLVRDFMSLIACGRQGMTAEELQTLLRKHAPIIDINQPLAKFPDMSFARLRRAFGVYLFERSGVIDFFHSQLKEAVGKRYLAEEADRDKTHQTIAAYFEKRWAEPYPRALDELPHQLTKARNWEGLECILCDLHFIETKCAAGMTYDLIHDYNIALDALPEAQGEKLKDQEHQVRVRKYIEKLIAYSREQIGHLDIIPSVRPWTNEEIKADSERITNNPTRLNRLQAFSQFVNSESYSLVKFSSYPSFCIQQAYNSAGSGPVAVAASAIVDSGKVAGILLLRNQLQRPDFNPHPALLKTIEGHTSAVKCVSITPDGKTAISGSSDKTLRMWDIDTGQCLLTLEGLTESVECVSVTPDGKRAVVGSDYQTMWLWDLENRVCLRPLYGHKGQVNCVSITPDGKRAVSGSFDESLLVWDLKSGQCLRSLDGHTNSIECVAITPDGKRAVSGSEDKTLRVWDLESGRCLGLPLEGHTSGVKCVSMTPDGKRAVSGSWDAKLKVWDLDSGCCTRTLAGHLDGVECVSITPDGKTAISGSYDGTLEVWDLENGSCIRTIEGHTKGVKCVGIIPDGKRAVSGSYDNTLKVWNIESGQYLEAFERHKRKIYCVGITPDGKRAVSGSYDHTLRVWDLPSSRCLRTMASHVGCVCCVSITPDGERAVSGSWDKTLKVWDLESGRCLRTLEGHTEMVACLSLTPDGRRVISGSGGDFTKFNVGDHNLRVWDLESGQCLRMLEGHKNSVRCVSITPDGRRAISGSSDCTLRVWDLENGHCLRTLEGHSEYDPQVRRFKTIGGHSYLVNCVSITPDGKVAVSGSSDYTLRVWDLESGQCLGTPLEGHTDSIKCVSITPDGKRAVSGSYDNSLKVWDLESAQCLGTLSGHTAVVSYVKITPDGKRAISGGEDGSLRVWDLQNKQCLALCVINSAIYCGQIAQTSSLLEVVLGLSTGEVIFLTFHNFPIDRPIVTPEGK